GRSGAAAGAGALQLGRAAGAARRHPRPPRHGAAAAPARGSVTIAVPAAQFARPARFDARWRRHALILAGVWAALLLFFARDVADMAALYWNSSTYGHCL